jgi:hypothetical protein
LTVNTGFLVLVKLEVLEQLREQAGANTGANATLSETVALLIESWSRMTPRQMDWLRTLLQPEMGDWD